MDTLITNKFLDIAFPDKKKFKELRARLSQVGLACDIVNNTVIPNMRAKGIWDITTESIQKELNDPKYDCYHIQQYRSMMTYNGHFQTIDKKKLMRWYGGTSEGKKLTRRIKVKTSFSIF